MGILTKESCEKCDADCIVTAVVLGMAKEAGKGLQVVVEGKDDLPRLQKALAKVNGALKAVGRAAVTAAIAPPWKAGEFITGGLKIHPVDDTMKKFISNDGKDMPQYLGRGAYTGMVLVKGAAGKDELKYWGSTFEVDVKKGPRKLGQRLPMPLANMHKQSDGASAIKGYVHGMIQAMYVGSKLTRAQAKTLELAAGTETLKLASCIACTTFMLANNVQPSGIHLGAANSWVPVDPANAWAMAEMQGDQCDESLKRKDLDKDVVRMNKAWVDKVGVWMCSGATLDKSLVTDKDLSEKAVCKGHEGKWNHQKSWEKLQAFAKNPGPAHADTFLDALGYHYSDTARILDTLG